MKKQIYLTMLAACLCLLANSQTVIPSYVPTNGLVGWWPFNGNANDLSVNAINGTVNGATLTSDRYGNANKAYETTSGYISVQGTTIPTNGLMSISFWFNCNSDFGIGEIICLGNPSSTTWGCVGGNNVFGLNYGRGCGSTGTSPIIIPLNYGTWHHVVYVSSGLNTNSNIYYDGIFAGNSTNANSNNNCSNAVLYFGVDIFSFIENYPGKLDDIGIWNRALTPCEIKKLYTSGSFSVSSSASNTICVGQSLNLSAAGANSYTWSTGATSQSISVSPTVSTVYTVSTTYSAGCTDSRTFNVTVNVCTGLNETEFATNSVRIFPNPAKEQLNISLNNIALIGKNYSITNALGQVMATGVFNKQTMELTIQQFSSGLYQLNIDGLQENYKFIKE
jgi:hypothetical protein